MTPTTATADGDDRAMTSTVGQPVVKSPPTTSLGFPLTEETTLGGVLSSEEVEYFWICRKLRDISSYLGNARGALAKAQAEFDEYQVDANEWVTRRDTALAALIAASKQD